MKLIFLNVLLSWHYGDADRAIQVQQILRADDSNVTDFQTPKTGADFLKKHVMADEATRAVSTLPCGSTTQVHSGSDKAELCPPECPFYAQNINDGLHCTFMCVKAEQCREMNPNRPIADTLNGQRICRGPVVADCAEMSLDGTDTCIRCQFFYKVSTGNLEDGGLGAKGQCIFRFQITFYIIAVCCFLMWLFMMVFIVDWLLRPCTNERGLKQGLAYRTCQKIHTPRTDGQHRTLFPDDTNLCKTEVAGPGMLLHFNYQAMCALWAFVIGLVWVLYAFFVDDALLILGTRKFGTPRENCILVAWGYETQQRLMWTKVQFLIWAYFITFIGSLLHSIRQRRIFDLMDSKTKSMKDFAAIVGGLDCTGDQDWETKIAKVVEKATGKHVVGVSICWDYKEDEELVLSILEDDLAEREKKFKTGVEPRTTKDENQRFLDNEGYPDGTNGVRKKLMGLELYAAGADPFPTRPENMKEWLAAMKSSEEAFVVFNTEQDRNEAVETAGGTTIDMEGMKLDLTEADSEPEAIKWENFADSKLPAKLRRFAIGLSWIFAALFFWTTVFYTPYAYQVFTFNYDNGAEPPFYLAMTFCMVVVLGNAIMYEVCGRVSDYIGFKTRDQRESCYLILYVVACCFNVTLDMATTYVMALKILEGLNFRTYYGVKLEDVPNFTSQFETYAMQRVLAENTKAYCFPATYLIPFLIEPFITVYFPLKLGQWMVQSHPEWVGRDAELWMVSFEFDMGRYGDLLLNQLLGILIFYFPGGYTKILFWGMAGSHVYIYLFDHLRVIKTIPKCVYATMEVDWWAQWMLAPITATIASCFVFKANCQGWGYCTAGVTLLEICFATWVGQLILHTLCLVYLVPLFRKTDHPDPQANKTFKECAQELPCSWFASNPIHCLRSKYYYDHKPPCSFYTLGKEHLQEINEKINCFFQDDKADEEDYTDGGVASLAGKLTMSLSGALKPN